MTEWTLMSFADKSVSTFGQVQCAIFSRMYFNAYLVIMPRVNGGAMSFKSIGKMNVLERIRAKPHILIAGCERERQDDNEDKRECEDDCASFHCVFSPLY